MLLVLLAGYVLMHATQAAPQTITLSSDVTVDANAPPICACDNPSNQRATMDIIWSCLTTIFACTWIAVHPNIPAPDDSWWKITRRRAKVMLYALIAPEMVIYWAMRQCVGARQLAKKYHDRGWTETHGFFLQMGGFMVEGDGSWPPHPLSAIELDTLDTLGRIQFPTISEDEIMDKSKGDLLSKAIVAIQTSWFIAQCIARGIQGLVITELELVTLGFAVLNGMMYYAWWKKPLDVHFPVPVHLTKSDTLCNHQSEKVLHIRVVDEREHSSTCATDEIKEIDDMPRVHAQSPDALHAVCLQASVFTEFICFLLGKVSAFLTNAVGALRVFASHVSGTVDKTLQHFREEATAEGVCLAIWYIVIYRPAATVLRPIARMTAAGGKAYHAEMGDLKVSTYHAMQLTQEADRCLDLISAGIAVVFGAIHCAGWSFHFPSHQEQILWRTASIVVTSVPLYFLFLVLMVLCVDYPKAWHNSRLWSIVSLLKVLRWLLLATIICYILARLALVIQAFASLRALPPGAYEDVQWTSFIPHI